MGQKVEKVEVILAVLAQFVEHLLLVHVGDAAGLEDDLDLVDVELQ